MGVGRVLFSILSTLPIVKVFKLYSNGTICNLKPLRPHNDSTGVYLGSHHNRLNNHKMCAQVHKCNKGTSRNFLQRLHVLNKGKHKH